MGEEQGYRHRRNDDPDGEFVRTVRRTDEGLQISRRFIEIIVILVGFGISIGINWQKFDALAKTVEGFARHLEVVDDKASKASKDAEVARVLTERQEATKQATELEMAQWRATFKAIAMIQQQGGGKVTLSIPERPRQENKDDGGSR